jgi:hypothetical protein
VSASGLQIIWITPPWDLCAALPICVLALFHQVKEDLAIGCQLAHKLDRATSICEQAPDSCTLCYVLPAQRHIKLHAITTPKKKKRYPGMAFQIIILNFHTPPSCIWFCCSIIMNQSIIKYTLFMLSWRLMLQATIFGFVNGQICALISTISLSI